MTTITELRPRVVELPPLTAEEQALVTQINSDTEATGPVLERFVAFLQQRRDIVDTLVKAVYEEWPCS